MKRIDGQRVAAEELDSHHYICDLVRFEHPLLSLYSDGRRNWLHLWVDVDSTGHNRWVVFQVSRDSLSEYLKGALTLLDALQSSRRLWLVDLQENLLADEGSRARSQVRRTVRAVTPDEITEYLPTADSYFDPDLTTDLDLTKQVVPDVFEVPIAGTWFSRDFKALFKRYEWLYAFLYATRPQFVKTVSDRLAETLRAPWEGGGSRVQMFSGLDRDIPAIHSLRVKYLQFASPGAVRFEALRDIGELIEKSMLTYIESQDAIEESARNIRKALTAAKLNKFDASGLSDRAFDASLRNQLNGWSDEIGVYLNLSGEFENLRQHAPNSVVHSKAVVSFVRQLSNLALLQQEGMLNFGSGADQEDLEI